jgi:serine/threonine protein kinase
VAFGAVVTAQTLEALAYLHAKGVIHRDLSPDNIMVMRGDDGQPLVKLIDLGIAKLVESEHNLTAAGSFIGKVRYASPELFRTKEGIRIDHRSDLYSMGLVVYELLTGVHPMGETDVSGYIAGHLFNAPEPFASSDPKERIPSDFRHAILRALAKAPDNRFSSARGFRRRAAGPCRPDGRWTNPSWTICWKPVDRPPRSLATTAPSPPRASAAAIPDRRSTDLRALTRPGGPGHPAPGGADPVPWRTRAFAPPDRPRTANAPSSWTAHPRVARAGVSGRWRSPPPS